MERDNADAQGYQKRLDALKDEQGTHNRAVNLVISYHSFMNNPCEDTAVDLLSSSRSQNEWNHSVRKIEEVLFKESVPRWWNTRVVEPRLVKDVMLDNQKTWSEDIVTPTLGSIMQSETWKKMKADGSLANMTSAQPSTKEIEALAQKAYEDLIHLQTAYQLTVENVSEPGGGEAIENSHKILRHLISITLKRGAKPITKVLDTDKVLSYGDAAEPAKQSVLLLTKALTGNNPMDGIQEVAVCVVENSFEILDASLALLYLDKEPKGESPVKSNLVEEALNKPETAEGQKAVKVDDTENEAVEESPAPDAE